MSTNISTELNTIATATYGSEMREAIHDAIEKVNKSAFGDAEQTVISSTTYNSLGIHDVTDIEPGKVYAVRNNVTEEMVSNLPFYGSEGTLMAFQPYVSFVGDGTGYTVYFYFSGGSEISYGAFAYSYTNGIISPWVGGYGQDNFKIVGKGAPYKTIAAALLGAKDGDTIILLPGTYEEHISVVDGKELHFVGLDKHSTIVIDKSGDYRTPPFEIACGSISNMTIIETGEGTVSESNYNKMAYCIHCDYGTSAGKTLRLDNLILKNGCHACIGIGVRDGYNLIIENCDMELEEELGGSGIGRGALYIHTYAAESPGNAFVSIRNTIIRSGDDIAETLQPVSNQNVGFDLEHINCSIVANGKVDSSIISNGSGGTPTFSGSIKKGILSHGNNVDVLNYS